MKLIKLLMPLAAVAFMFTSCNEKQSTAATTTTPEETATETVAVPEEDVVITLTNSENLPEATAEKPVVIDFNATWCGPCQKFGPVFHNVAKLYSDKATFVSIDTDVCPDIAEKYGVQSIPYILVLKADGTTANSVGYLEEADFKAFLDSNL